MADRQDIAFTDGFYRYKRSLLLFASAAIILYLVGPGELQVPGSTVELPAVLARRLTFVAASFYLVGFLIECWLVRTLNSSLFKSGAPTLTAALAHLETTARILELDLGGREVDQMIPDNFPRTEEDRRSLEQHLARRRQLIGGLVDSLAATSKRLTGFSSDIVWNRRLTFYVWEVAAPVTLWLAALWVTPSL